MKTFNLINGNVCTIRMPEMSDLEALLKFINDLIAEDLYILRAPEDTISLVEEKVWLRSKIEQIKSKEAVVLSVFLDKEVIGQVHLEVGEYRGKHLGKIGISVAKDYRGHGLGRKLMEEIEIEARKLKLKILHLEVFVDNKSAIELYKSLGYKEFGVLPQAIEYQNTMVDEMYLYKNLT